MIKTSLENLKNFFIGTSNILILGIGFDQRCMLALQSLSLENLEKIIGISNLHSKPLNNNNIAFFKSLSQEKHILLGENAKNIINLVDEIVLQVNQLENIHKKNIFVDITSMSHELLTMLIGLFHQLDLLKQIKFLYLNAEKYSTNTSDEELWLSRGVRAIRSVLGFPGIMYPSKKLHLIILAGFEVERAQHVIVDYEPARLSIGKGSLDQSISTAHHKRNTFFASKLENIIKTKDIMMEKVDGFEFSCIEPMLAKEQIIEYIKLINTDSDYNHVLVPLNTKISTIGAALAALEIPELQICYAEAEEYNYENYVQPGNLITIFEV